MNISSNNPSCLVLGTAQLGMNYGVANITGKPDFVEARNAVRCAWTIGILEFDTAQGYGDSAATLGYAIRHLE